jgi:type VII secretion protein EccB
MPTNPTTKSQVQAYRFVLRRMESALVRKDAVLVHEPMRNHLRAAAVGVILGILGLAAFFVVGLFSPAGKVGAGDIVNIKGTAQVFVAVEPAGGGESPRLVPVLNLTSARLLVAALDPGTAAAPDTKIVEAATLAHMPRLNQTGLPGAPDPPASLVSGDWSVCDTAVVRDDLPNAESRPELSTTAIVGVPRPGRPLRPDQALLVQAETTGAHYLVWHGRRLPVDLDDSAAQLAYRLSDAVPRKVSASLLNAIPEGDRLAPPDIEGMRDPAPFPQLPAGIRVGDVVQVDLAEDRFFLVLRQGKQEVQPAVAGLIRADHGSSDEFVRVAPEAIADVPFAPESSRKDFSDFPARAPRILDIRATPVACLVWQGADRDPVVTVGAEEKPPTGEGVLVPGAVSGQADRVFLEPGKGALVRGMVPGQPAGTGTIWLVTDQGLRYAVPSIEVARALGLGDTVAPAPESILGLLKIGPVLDPRQALVLYDPDLAGKQADG